MSQLLSTLGSSVCRFFHKLTRRKVISFNPLQSQLKRVLTAWGITLFGLGQMAGGGPFVVAGAVAHMAGPGIILSFLIAGLAAILSGTCFAEFAAAIPRAGSGYLFSYVTMGEFVGFLVGWQMILDQVLNVASVSSAISGAFDSLSGGLISNFTIQYVGIFNTTAVLAPYPDLLGCGIGVLAAISMSFGLSNSALLSNILNSLNLVVILVCTCFGFSKADPSNWIHPGFLPFGFAGVLRGASNSFSAYIGFESIASAGEETIDPRRSIPAALLSALGTLVVLYVFLGMALTLASPLHEIYVQAAFPHLFAYHGYEIAKDFIAIGIAVGMFGALIGSLYGVSRTAYAMASDGLLFKVFAQVNHRTSTPLFGEVTFGLLSAVFTLFFNLEILVEFQNVGTLLAYIIIAGCSILFNYQTRIRVYDDNVPGTESFRIAKPKDEEDISEDQNSALKVLARIFPEYAVDFGLIFFAIFVGVAFATSINVEQRLATRAWWPLVPEIIFLIIAGLFYFIIKSHRKRDLKLYFQIPFVPFIPAAAIALNILLVVYVSKWTWFRFLIWISLGLVIYLLYGIRNSAMSLPNGSSRTSGATFDAAEISGLVLPTLKNSETENERTPLLMDFSA